MHVRQNNDEFNPRSALCVPEEIVSQCMVATSGLECGVLKVEENQ